MAARAVLALLVVLATSAGVAEELAYDVALRRARLYRGGVEVGGVGDVAVRGDRIVAVGEAPGRARREIDASGLVVAPGFIDLHTHTDEVFRRFGWLPLLPGRLAGHANYLTQGVTTVVTGNCGSGFATPEEIAAWLSEVDETPFGPNVIHLVPQGQLRLHVMGGAQADRPDPAATPEEMARMKVLLDGGMRAGAWGMSTGLEYDPGARTGTDELVELMQVVARHGGVYASHTRHEGPDPEQTLASYAEAIEIGERSGAPAHISHIKLSGPPVHGLAGGVVELVTAARARGVRVSADQYPYAAGSTTLSIVAPPEMRDGTAVLDRYCEGEGRAALRAGVAERLSVEFPPEAIQISVYPWRWWLQGRRLSEIAAERGADPVDVAMELACGWIGLGIFHNQDEADIRRFMAQDWVATASDGTASLGIVGRVIHPRAYGTFPRKIRRYAIDEGVVTVGQALRSMTELPASAFEIPGRGRLEPGAWADVVAFDPASLRDVATYERSGRASLGVEYLLVNGVLAIEAGELTGRRGGRALRHGR